MKDCLKNGELHTKWVWYARTQLTAALSHITHCLQPSQGKESNSSHSSPPTKFLLEGAKSILNTPTLLFMSSRKTCTLLEDSLSSAISCAYSQSDNLLSDQISMSLFSY